MILKNVLIRWVLMLGVFSVITTLAAAQTHSPLLVVVTKGGNSLTLIDPQTKKIVGVVPVGEHPHNVTVSPDGTLAFVTNQVSGSIPVVDIAARKELRRVNIGPGSRPHGIRYVG